MCTSVVRTCTWWGPFVRITVERLIGQVTMQSHIIASHERQGYVDNFYEDNRGGKIFLGYWN